jgi:hypothetical protein
MDLGKLYKQIVNAGGSLWSQQHGGKKPLVGRAFSLAAITEAVLGMPLCKVTNSEHIIVYRTECLLIQRRKTDFT